MSFGAGVFLPQRYTNNTTGPGSLHLNFLTGAPLDSRITFSRTTNATLVDSTGRVTYAPNNLFTNSEAFENAAWVKGNSTVTVDATVAPNGTTTADKLVENTVTTTHQITQQTAFVAGTSYTWSFFVKAAERSVVRVLFPAAAFTSNLTANFDLATGAWRTSSPTPSAGLTLASQDVGNGWYRISATATATASVNQTILLLMVNTPSGTGNYTGDGTSGLFIWGAQLEQVTYQTTPGTYNSTSPPNLFGFTQEFENAAWTKANATISPNATAAPNGSTTADKLVEDSSTGQHRFYATAASTTNTGSYTVSFFAKAAERTRVYVGVAESPTFARQGNAVFDLSAGTVVSANAGSGGASGGSATIQDAGNGWYRCSYTLILGGANTSIFVDFNLVSTGTTISYTGNGTSGLFIWGAQLSNSASVDPYVYNPGAAPTSTAYYGPRFDYDPVTLAPRGLLIEEQRVNSIRNSIGVGAVAGTPGTMPTNWARSGSGSPVNGISISVAGSGVEDGISYVDIRFSGTNTAAGNQYVDVSLDIDTAVAQNQSWTLSSYVRLVAGSLTGVLTSGIIIYGAPLFNDNASTSILSVTSAPLIRQRFSVTRTFALATTTGASPRLTVTVSTGATVDITLRIGLSQLEQGAFATSVIPTATAQVTRAADNATITGTNFSSWYNASEGTIVVSADSVRPSALSPATRVFQFDDGTTLNNIRTGGTATLQVVDANVTQVNITATPAITFDGTVFKFASAYKVNDFATVTTGAVATDTSGTVPAVTQLSLGGPSISGVLNGHIRTFTFYPQRLTNAQLQALTA